MDLAGIKITSSEAARIAGRVVTTILQRAGKTDDVIAILKHDFAQDMA